MIITSKKIQDLKELFRDHQKWDGVMSDQVKTVKERNGNNPVSVLRDGKTVEIKEKDLWQELYYGGFTSQAWEILAKKYPDIEEAHKNEEEIAIRMRDFTVRNFGFAFSQMSLVDLIDLIQGIRRYELMRFFFIDKLISIFYGIFGKKTE